MPENKAPQPPERIWLQIEGYLYEHEFIHCAEQINDDDIEYVRATHHNLAKAKLLRLIKTYIVPDDYDLGDQKKWLADYLKREGFEFLMEGGE